MKGGASKNTKQPVVESKEKQAIENNMNTNMNMNANMNMNTLVNNVDDNIGREVTINNPNNEYNGMTGHIADIVSRRDNIYTVYLNYPIDDDIEISISDLEFSNQGGKRKGRKGAKSRRRRKGTKRAKSRRRRKGRKGTKSRRRRKGRKGTKSRK